MIKKVFRISELKDEINDKYDKGVSKGEAVGFKCLEDLYTVKLGCTTYIYGSPTSGKSEFLFEVLINLTNTKGWRHALYTPESGTPSDIAIELMHKWSGKPFYDTLDRDARTNKLTKSEIFRLTAELDEYFYIIDAGEKGLSLEEFYNEVDEIEKEHKIKIHTTTTDPWNELLHSLGSEARDMYLEFQLGLVRRNARANHRHNFIITHVANQELKTATTAQGETVHYYDLATPRQISNGQSWFRKGEAMICAWRPPKDLTDSMNNRFYEANEVVIAIQKAKPKAIGKLGTARLFFDPERSRYYELDNFNKSKKYYAFELNKSREEALNINFTKLTETALKPSTQFDLDLEGEFEPPF